MDNTEKIRNIHRRQVARLLDHLHRTGQYTEQLEKDIKRSYGFAFQDVSAAITQVNDTEVSDDRGNQA